MRSSVPILDGNAPDEELAEESSVKREYNLLWIYAVDICAVLWAMFRL
jgi:hypothetical protein